MKSMVHVIRVALVLVLSAASATPAGIHEKGYEVGVYGGAENGDQRTQVPDSHILGLRAGGSFGFRAGYAFSKKIMAEVTVDGFPASRDVTVRVGPATLPARQIPTNVHFDTTFIAYTLGLTANFLTERDVKTAPYFDVSLGFLTEDRDSSTFSVRTNPSDPNTTINGVVLARKDTATALTVGGGARTFFTDALGLRYELKYIHHDTFGINQDGFQLSVGATFVIGGKK